MAKTVRCKIHLFSSYGSGHFYTTTKNKRKSPHSIALKKFDPFIRRHVLYKEHKMK